MVAPSPEFEEMHSILAQKEEEHEKLFERDSQQPQKSIVGKLSPSKITTYEGCHMAFYLQYIAHVKIPTNARLVFGKCIHYLLDHFYDVNFKSADSFAKFFCWYWAGTVSGEFLKGKEKANLEVREFPYQGRDKDGKKVTKILRVGNHVNLWNNPLGTFFAFRSLGWGILQKFYEQRKGKQPPWRREHPFGVKKIEPFEINGHPVQGVYDRIDIVDRQAPGSSQIKKEIYIGDYKTDTGSPENNAFVLHRHPQFTMYSYVLRNNPFLREELAKEHNITEPKESGILYFHLRSGKIFRTKRSEADYEYLKKLLDKVAKGIESQDFTPFYGFHCKMCDYQAACEKYSHPFHGGPRIDLEDHIKEAEVFDPWEQPVEYWMELIEP